MPKTSAERSREYRQRKNQKKIKKTAKSSTERVRAFRARKKASLDQQNNSFTENNQRVSGQSTNPLLPQIKVRDFAKLKNETSVEISSSTSEVHKAGGSLERISFNTLTTNSLQENAGCSRTTTRIVKSSTENSRDCRPRRRAANYELINSNSRSVQAKVHQKSFSSDNSQESIECIMVSQRKAKTTAERSREYRARKKALINDAKSKTINSSLVFVNSLKQPEISIIKVTNKSSDYSVSLQKNPKILAERCNYITDKKTLKNAESQKTFSPCSVLKTTKYPGKLLSENSITRNTHEQSVKASKSDTNDRSIVYPSIIIKTEINIETYLSDDPLTFISQETAYSADFL